MFTQLLRDKEMPEAKLPAPHPGHHSPLSVNASSPSPVSQHLLLTVTENCRHLGLGKLEFQEGTGRGEKVTLNRSPLTGGQAWKLQRAKRWQSEKLSP